MTSVVGFGMGHGTAPISSGFEGRLGSLRYITDLPSAFPPDSLSASDRISLGAKVLEKYGEAQFSCYQRFYRLTKEESDLIFKEAKSYEKDLVVWGPLDESAYREDVECVRSLHADAKFFLLTMKEENHRSMPVVEIEGKRYYFYSQAFKGPVVDEQYIANYDACRSQECRPDFKVVKESGRTVFLMECMGVQTPNFRDERDLMLLMDLIVRMSLSKKGLDMLPCRLAVNQGKMYCVDQKSNYGIQATEWDAFKHNLEMLKAKIQYRGYAEEGQLLVFVDKVAKGYEVDVLEKSLDNLKYVHAIDQMFPPDSLNSDQKISLAAASLRKFGSRHLVYIGRTYSLSVEDQKKAIRLAGPRLQNNIVTWDQDFRLFEELKQKTEQALQKQGLQGEFAAYLNQVGNFKFVLTVKIDGQIYVVRETDQKYIDEYQLRKEREHRPDFRVFPLEGGNFLFLAKFMGSQPVDYSDKTHVDRMIELAMHFSTGDTSTIDFNRGNLIVEGGALYYIDKDLTYAQSDNPRLENVTGVLRAIDDFFHVEHERATCKSYVKNKVRSMLDPQNPQDKKVLDFLFPPAPALSSIHDYRQFLAVMDMEKQEYRLALFDQLPIFFQTADEFLGMDQFKIAVLNKILSSDYAHVNGMDYYNLIEKRIGQLLKAFLEANK